MKTKMGTIWRALFALAWVIGGCSAKETPSPAESSGVGSGGMAPDGGYVLAGTYPASSGDKAHVLAAGDLDGDGATDVVLAGAEPDSAVVLRNAGDGTLQPLTTIKVTGTFTGLYGVYLGAMDAQPALDLVTLKDCSDVPCRPVEVFAGVGDGTFQPPVAALEVPAGNFYEHVMSEAAMVDLDGDGIDEIYATQGSELHAWLVRRSGDGSFTSEDAFAIHAPVMVDLDNDGALDLAGGHQESDFERIVVIRNEGNGAFGPPVKFGGITEAPYAMATGDLNTDGNQDLVGAAYNKLLVRLGAGDAKTFTPRDIVFEPGLFPWLRSPVVTDFDGDGHDDDVLVLQGDSVLVLIGEGDDFLPGPTLKVGSELLSLTVAEMNGDARPDLLITRKEPGELVVLLRAP
jgi:hypothetical protein